MRKAKPVILNAYIVRYISVPNPVEQNFQTLQVKSCMRGHIRRKKSSYSNVNSVTKHFSIKVVWLFMPQLTQMKDHSPAANVIGSTRKSMKKVIMNNSVEFHKSTHVNMKGVISHMLTQNCIMNIYVQNTAGTRKVFLSVHFAQKHSSTKMVDLFT